MWSGLRILDAKCWFSNRDLLSWITLCAITGWEGPKKDPKLQQKMEQYFNSSSLQISTYQCSMPSKHKVEYYINENTKDVPKQVGEKEQNQ